MLLFLSLSGSMEAFDLPFILTKGGPIGASETFVTKTVDVAFKFQNFGLASAMGVLLFIFVAILVTIQRKLVLRGDKE
jgi:multiple sugar transport system permease protein